MQKNARTRLTTALVLCVGLGGRGAPRRALVQAQHHDRVEGRKVREGRLVYEQPPAYMAETRSVGLGGRSVLAGKRVDPHLRVLYGTEDLEGHHWYFAEKIREMSSEEWQPSPEDLKGHS